MAKRIQFLQDYRGVLTGELFYPEGAIVDPANALRHVNAVLLVEHGRAVYIDDPESEPQEHIDGQVLPEEVGEELLDFDVDWEEDAVIDHDEGWDEGPEIVLEEEEVEDAS